MKKIIIFFIFIIIFSQLFCTNALNDLFSNGKVSSSNLQEFNAAQYKYLGYMYDSTFGELINDDVFTEDIMNSNPDEIQKVLNVTLQFPFQQCGVMLDDGFQPQDLQDISWWTTLPSEIIGLMNANWAIEPGADDIAIYLARFLDSDEGSDAINEFVDINNNRINMLINYALDPINNPFNNEIYEAINESNTILNDDILESFSGITYGIIVTQIASMIKNQIVWSDTESQLTGLLSKLNQIISRQDEIEQSLTSIEKIFEDLDNKVATVQDIQFILSRQKVDEARSMLAETYNHLQSLISETHKKEFLEDLLIIQNRYGQLYSDAFDAAIFNHNYIKQNELADLVNTNIRIDTWTDLLHTNLGGCTISCDSCLGGNVAGCIYCWTCEDPVPVETIIIDIKEPFQYINFSIQDIALMKRLSLERLSLLANIFSGDELLLQRANFAQQDLSKLLQIKDSINNMKSTIDQYISSRELDPNGAPFWNLINPYEDDAGREQETSEDLRNALHNFIDDNSYFKDYKIAAYSIVLNWEIQLRAHIAAGE